MSGTPFSPTPVGTVKLTVTTTAGSVALPTMPSDGPVAITNDGTSTMFIKFGTSAVAAVVPGASAGDYPVLAGTQVILDRGNAAYVSAITATGTATLYATTGDGQ